MVFQLGMSFVASSIVLDVYKKNVIVNTVCVDDWTAEWATIASNELENSIVSIYNRIILTFNTNANEIQKEQYNSSSGSLAL